MVLVQAQALHGRAKTKKQDSQPKTGDFTFADSANCRAYLKKEALETCVASQAFATPRELLLRFSRVGLSVLGGIVVVVYVS